jgi:hypothetical protein
MSAGKSLSLLVPVVGTVVLAAGVAGARERATPVVAGGQARAVIVWWSPSGSPVTRFAASELRDYLRRMSRARVPVRRVRLHGHRPKRLGGGVAIVTGLAAARFRHASVRLPSRVFTGLATRLAGAPEDSFGIDASGDYLALAGRGERGALYAAYEWLERAGVRFFAPEFIFYGRSAERVPRRRTVALGRSAVVEQPRLRFRRKYVEEGWSHTPTNLVQLVDWMAKTRQNILVHPYDYYGQGVTRWDAWRNRVARALIKRGIALEVGGHGFESFLPPAQFPRYYTSGTNVFDVHNDAAVAAYVDRVVAYLRARPEIRVFDAWPPDSAVWPAATLQRYGSAPNAYAHVVNALSARLRREPPRVRVEAIAYQSHVEPPSQGAMHEPQTIIDFATYDRSYRVPIWDPSHEWNRSYVALVERWRQAFGGELAVYEYYRKYSWHSLPVVLARLISREVRYYDRVLGADGIGTYSEPADWIPYELIHALLAALSWDPTSGREFVRDYVCDRYGAAAPAMRRYYALVEDAGRTLFDRPRGDYDNLDAVTRARDDYRAARECSRWPGAPCAQAAPRTG